MATLSLIVNASTDDARNIFSNSTFTATAATQHLGNFSGTRYYNGWRFNSVTIPQGATITSAKLTMYVSNVNGGTQALVSFWGEATDNPVTFSNTTANKPQGRAHTTAQVDQTFTTANWGTVGYQTNSSEIPELATIVQEIVNRAGWTSGNSLVIVGFDNSSTNPGYVGFSTWDNASTKATKLDITYSVNTSPTVALNTPTDTATVATATPTLNFTGTDADSDAVEYNAQVDTANTFDGAVGTIAIDAQAGLVSNGFAAGSARTWSHTCTGATALVVSVMLWQDVAGAGTISAMTYNGVALTKSQGVTSGAMRAEIWYLLNPSSGTNTLSATVSGNTDDRKFRSVSYTGVGAIDASNSATGGTGNPTVSVTTTVNNAWVQDAMAKFGTTSNAVGSGQTSVMNDVSGSTTAGASYEGPKTPAGSVTMDWTNASGNDWATVALALAPGVGPLINAFSATDAGFTAGHPFTSGVAKDYTTQVSLTNSTTYYWRVRAIDPSGTNTYGAWATTRSFTVSVSGGTAYAQSLSGALTLTGALAKQPRRSLAGGLSFSGAIVKQPRRSLTGGLSFSGSLKKGTNRALTGALTFVGGVTASHVFAKALSAALTFSGAMTKKTQKSLTGGLSFTGSLTKQMQRSLAAAITFSGGMTKQAKRALSGALTFSGSVGTTKTLHMALTAALTLSGSLSKQTRKPLTGGLSLTGSMVKQTARSLTAAITFSGGLAKRTQRTFAGAVTFVGSLASSHAFTKALTAALTFSGSTTKKTSRALTGGLTFSGSLAKQTGRALTAALTLAGAIQKQTAKPLSGSLTFSGGITRRIGRTMSAALTFSGSLATSFMGHLGTVYQQALSASLSFSGSMTKQTNKGLTASLGLTGGINRAISRSLTASLTFTGGFLRRLIRITGLVHTVSTSNESAIIESSEAAVIVETLDENRRLNGANTNETLESGDNSGTIASRNNQTTID